MFLTGEVAGAPRTFAAALDQLREVHDSELLALQSEIARLHAEVARLMRLDADSAELVVKQNAGCPEAKERSSPCLVVGRPHPHPSKPPAADGAESKSFRSTEQSASQSLGTGSRRKHKEHEELRIISIKESAHMKKTPSDRIGPLEKLVESFAFEVFFAILITAQTVVMATESQYIGDSISHSLFEEHTNAGGVWPGADIVYSVFSWFFGIIFGLEICLKMLGLRRRFWRDAWNWLDTIIVLCWVAQTSLEWYFPVNFGVDPEVLRIMRLARLVRLVRLVRTVQGFDAIYVITTALQGSLPVLAWSCVVLLVFQSLMALLLQKLLADVYFTDSSQPVEQRQEVFIYFGTFTRAVFSMYEITLANWPPVSRVLAENVSQWFMLFAVVHKLTIGFALIGILNGVLLQETFKVASTDDRIMVRQKEKATNMHAKKMHLLFRSADSSGNGLLDLQEFREVLREPGVKTWLAAMELDAGEDADNLFSLLDKENGQVSADALIKGMARLKGSARSIDMVSLMHEVKQLQEQLLAVKTAGSTPEISGRQSMSICLQAPDSREGSGAAAQDGAQSQPLSPSYVQGVPSRSFCWSDSSDDGDFNV
jgi:hypothetical protein